MDMNFESRLVFNLGDPDLRFLFLRDWLPIWPSFDTFGRHRFLNFFNLVEELSLFGVNCDDYFLQLLHWICMVGHTTSYHFYCLANIRSAPYDAILHLIMLLNYFLL